jgi:hypothetical protein
MKKYFTLVFMAITIIGNSQTATNQFYNLTPGNGNGVRFWSDDNYKIHMGSGANYFYGPVQDYSIKMNMNNDPDRGWTWGVLNMAPIAALNTQGSFQLAKDLTVLGNAYFGTASGRVRARHLDGMTNGGGLDNLYLNWGVNYDVMICSWGSTGGVGIGINNAITTQQKLHIVSQYAGGSGDFTNITNAPLCIEADGTDKYWRAMHLSTNSIISGVYNYQTGKNVYWGEPTDQGEYHFRGRDFFVTDGNVGIGTTNPGEFKLAVAGKIHATEIQVDALPWPDFVFTPTYNLRTLTEVENFITQNQHLPDVPSQAEVASEGVSLGEMNAILLQKIEELTLYTIEQEKKIEKLQKLESELDNLKEIVNQINKQR